VRNIVSLLSGLFLMTALAACGGETEPEAPPAKQAAQTESAQTVPPEPAPAAPTPAETPEEPEPKAAQAAMKPEPAPEPEPEPEPAPEPEEATDDVAATGDGTVHEIEMLNSDPDNPKQKMVYRPRILSVAPGDTVRFVPTNPGHNSASTKGMLPAGVEGWKSGINKEFEITLTTPGIYGYNCTPHKASGMVGLIVVKGEGMLDNLADAKKARQIGKAKNVWKDIWAEAEASGLLTP